MDHTTIVAPAPPRISTPTGGSHRPGAGGGRASGGVVAPCDEAGGAVYVRGAATGEPGQPRDSGDLAVSGAVEALGPHRLGSIERPYERRREDRA